MGQGQFIGAPNWSHDILTAKSQGQPIDNLNPQPTGFEVGAVSIIKGGPNPDGAKAFVDWVLTKEAGVLNVKLSTRLRCSRTWRQRQARPRSTRCNWYPMTGSGRRITKRVS